MKRIYELLINQHLNADMEMLFLMGPRQVGKTTLARRIAHEPAFYLNWDDQQDRRTLQQSQQAFYQSLHLHQHHARPPLLIFDEIHKNPGWKNWLKGLYDRYQEDVRILVTGSARLDVYHTGGDSLLGRYFRLRIHPFSVGELVQPALPSTDTLFQDPIAVDAELLSQLYHFSGFPKPFLKQEKTWHRRWQNTRLQLLLQEDIRDLTAIRQLVKLEQFVDLMSHQAARTINLQSMAQHLGVAHDTVATWLDLLKKLYIGFTIPPWSTSVARSLKKQPKFFLWDWTMAANHGARVENIIASHLLKAVHLWNDLGLGDFGLYYIRTKEKYEVDFLITQNQSPWILIEAKSSGKASLSPHLARFQQQLNCPHALQVAWDLPYEPYHCLSIKTPKIVSAATFLSQLV